MQITDSLGIPVPLETAGRTQKDTLDSLTETRNTRDRSDYDRYSVQDYKADGIGGADGLQEPERGLHSQPPKVDGETSCGKREGASSNQVIKYCIRLQNCSSSLNSYWLGASSNQGIEYCIRLQDCSSCLNSHWLNQAIRKKTSTDHKRRRQVGAKKGEPREESPRIR